MFDLKTKKQFASRLRTIRSECGLTQDALSLVTGLDRSTLSYYENGMVFPSLNRLCEFASLFGLSLDELMGVSNSTLKFSNDDSFDSKFDNEEAFDINDEFIKEEEDDMPYPDFLGALREEEQHLVLYFRQLLENDRELVLLQLAEKVGDLRSQFLDSYDEDTLLVSPEEFERQKKLLEIENEEEAID